MQFLKMLFTWWHGATLGTALFTSRRGRLIGTDDQGNKYYVDKKNQSLNGKVRRWVIYEGDVEASRVPPEYGMHGCTTLLIHRRVRVCRNAIAGKSRIR